MGIISFFHRLCGRKEIPVVAHKKEMLSQIHSRGEPIIVLEAGASDGTDTLKFSNLLKTRRFFHPENRIYAFEPVPESFVLLQKMVADCPNVCTIPQALGSNEGEQLIWLSRNEVANDSIPSSSSLLSPKETLTFHPHIKFDAQCTVKTTTLDSWAEANEVKKIDFMWLDMQGMEMKALQSGLTLLKTTKAIFSEVSFLEMYEGAPLYAEYKSFLESLGFFVVFEDRTYEDMGNVFFKRNA